MQSDFHVKVKKKKNFKFNLCIWGHCLNFYNKQILFNILKSHDFLKFFTIKVLRAGRQSLCWLVSFPASGLLTYLLLEENPTTPAPRSPEPESETAFAGFTCLENTPPKENK